MEEIIYIIIGVIGVVLAFIFGKRTGHDGRATMDRVDDTVERTRDGLGVATKQSIDVANQSTELRKDIERHAKEFDNYTEQVKDIGDGLSQSSKRLDTITKRHERCTDIVEELQKRHSTTED